MPIKYTRKIITVGGSAALTLPPAWLQYHGLERGDYVEIVIDKDLVVQPQPGHRRRPRQERRH